MERADGRQMRLAADRRMSCRFAVGSLMVEDLASEGLTSRLLRPTPTSVDRLRACRRACLHRFFESWRLATARTSRRSRRASECMQHLLTTAGSQLSGHFSLAPQDVQLTLHGSFFCAALEVGTVRRALLYLCELQLAQPRTAAAAEAADDITSAATATMRDATQQGLPAQGRATAQREDGAVSWLQQGTAAGFAVGQLGAAGAIPSTSWSPTPAANGKAARKREARKLSMQMSVDCIHISVRLVVLLNSLGSTACTAQQSVCHAELQQGHSAERLWPSLRFLAELLAVLLFLSSSCSICFFPAMSAMMPMLFLTAASHMPCQTSHLGKRANLLSCACLQAITEGKCFATVLWGEVDVVVDVGGKDGSRKEFLLECAGLQVSCSPSWCQQMRGTAHVAFAGRQANLCRPCGRFPGTILQSNPCA